MSTVDLSMMNTQLITPAFLSQAPASAPPLAGSGGAPVGEAQQPLGSTGAGGGASGQSAPNPIGFMLPILVIFGVMIFFQIFAGRKERRKRQEMLSSIGKYDRVQTVGGLIGTVHDVKDTEITLKVDESTNTKVHISRSAVQQVLRKGPSSGGSSGGSSSDASSSKNETLEAVAS